ncbi:uncharacterized protein Z518_00761 [Rhinocladiella mackenziei CBS 650.93]|uniref:Rhinocladiella mackenziei CBS 650.93 unplaced genomic scaffold supercont1.1, whole genome shotgun sequence n=1 Tax=Rhinocladiella mackenziei CBS 650.93 TaxID=1442369 RepID=A0A0D2JJP8_9EURO|nr:uncharacterized protein Z518_00761 [Rhinocladiella mackenziei CBS 650.93]KIX09680.1 hypothetical protein Z518_00761 [Rhinocladiella mackenziei CBS 650.93]
MDDIAGLKWTSTPANGQKPATSNYSAFKPTPPTSGRASPFNATSSQPPSKPATPVNDSFANLVSFGASSNKNLSLLEQQKKQAETKLRQQQSRNQAIKDQYAGGDDQFWSSLGNRRGTPPATVSNPQDKKTNSTNNGLDDDDDLLAAFNKPATMNNNSVAAPVQKNAMNDDDPFGLSEAGPRRTDTTATTATASTLDDDDVLGLLGKPVSTQLGRESPPPVAKNDDTELHVQDKAMAELVDMGFPADKARQALEATDSGTDVQAAVGYLLNQAHSESRQKAQSRNTSRPGADADNGRWNDRSQSRTSRPQRRFEDIDVPRNRQQGPAHAAEKDFEQMAAEFGNHFLRTAGSLWKQGTKRVQQAVQEFNSDSESGSQPRWMREAERAERMEHRPRQREADVATARPSPEPQGSAGVTDEAMMLESSRPTPPPRPSATSRPDRRLDPGADNSRDHSPAVPSRLRECIPPKQPAFLRRQNPSPAANSRATLNREAAEEQAAQAYVSSARRRKPQPQPQSAPHQQVIASEPDLLEGSFKAAASPRPTTTAASVHPSPSRPVSRVETPARSPPTRNIPSVSAISMKACHSHREKGNEHFKRGDYSAAHQSYTSSISHLPDGHPLVIVLLTNRALTALKIGDPKTAISDADKAMRVIGPSKGESETVDFGTRDTPKSMRDYYGKALMRKAEALEQMEKWSDAAVVWREAVEGGHGGATSIQGRMRAEKAADPQASQLKSAAVATKKPAAASVPPRRSAGQTPSSSAPAAAVTRLRAANLAAEKADDEKFRLSDSVDARIQAWKGGKADNLRALLGSLENVLWEGSGWKKISMADLVLPNKVKIQYMKGIAKVHPDKIPTDATTEQRMIAGAVFSALNEAWDKFKTENGL